MRKTMALSLILTGCLSGCDVAAVISKPPAERVTASGLKARSGAVKTLKPKAQDAEDQTPASQPSSGNTSETPAESDEVPETVATEASETEQEAEVAQTTLALVEATETDISVIPVIEDDGSVSSLLFQNDRSTLSWEVEATRGPSALAVSTVRLTLTPLTWYPVQQDPFASEEAVASDAAASDSSEAGGAQAPSVIELPPGELSWPASFAAGATQTLTYDADAAAIRTFLESNDGVSRFSLGITLLDAAGEPLMGESEEPFTLKQSIQVL